MCPSRLEPGTHQSQQTLETSSLLLFPRPALSRCRFPESTCDACESFAQEHRLYTGCETQSLGEILYNCWVGVSCRGVYLECRSCDGRTHVRHCHPLQRHMTLAMLHSLMAQFEKSTLMVCLNKRVLKEEAAGCIILV